MKRGVWVYRGNGLRGYRDGGVSAALFLYHYPATPLSRCPVTPLYPFKP